MSYHSDHHNTPPDVRWQQRGLGLQILAQCMGCHMRQPQLGGRGQPGARWRCARCVQARQARQAAGAASA